jgi:hypothetical protein
MLRCQIKRQNKTDLKEPYIRAITYGCPTHMAEDFLGDGVFLMGPLRTCLLQTLFHPPRTSSKSERT